MKAMNPEMFWALARHLQTCGHSLKVHALPGPVCVVHLACGDPFFDADERTLYDFKTVDAAKAHATANGITAFSVLEHQQCPLDP